jgi:flagellum-specific peptidoglycan hydrolase FlgJ
MSTCLTVGTPGINAVPVSRQATIKASKPVKVTKAVKETSKHAVAELNIVNMYAELRKQGIQHPKIVLAQSILETGWYTSYNCKNYNNCFGLYDSSKGRYMHFKSWQSSVKIYKEQVQCKYNKSKHRTYYDFLAKAGYAEDKAYIAKLKELAGTIDDMLANS